MQYYRGNALYRYIHSHHISDFHYVAGNMWQLVYGNHLCQPQLLILAIGATHRHYHHPFLEEEIEAFQLLKKLSEASGVPLKILKFNADASNIETLILFNDIHEKGYIISLRQLSVVFAKYGLPVSNSSTVKYLNDKTSSAFHKWQRECLGKKLTVSDIDLWRTKDEATIECIFELKRSYIPIDRWKPFRDDYQNFRLLSKLANMAGIDFKIAYNNRYKKPFKDDVSKIKVFKVDFNRETPIWDEGIFKTRAFFEL